MSNSSTEEKALSSHRTNLSSHRRCRVRRERKFNDGPRTHAVTIMLTDREHTLLQQHLTRRRVTNRSRYLRSILLKDILHKLNASPPSLFDHIHYPQTEESAP